MFAQSLTILVVFSRYFTLRFPRLPLTCYCFARVHCSEEPLLAK